MDKNTLWKEASRHIPSELMRNYLDEQFRSEAFAPSVDDMITIVNNTCGFTPYGEFLTHARELAGGALRAEIDGELSRLAFAREVLKNESGKYLFGFFQSDVSGGIAGLPEENIAVCGEFGDKAYVFTDAGEALRYHKQVDNNNADSLVVFDAETRDELYYVSFCENGDICSFDKSVYSSGGTEYTRPEIGDRYVKLPHPFRTGDIVRFAGSETLYAVISADQPEAEISDMLCRFDMSVMVVPYKYRHLADAEYLARRALGDHEADDISRYHEHIPLLYLERAEEAR